MKSFITENENFRIKRSKDREFEIHAILDETFSKPVQLIDFLVIKITNKNLIQKILAVLPQLNTKFNHLKRIKNNEILFTHDLSFNNSIYLNKIQSIEESAQLDVVKVPLQRPKTKSQFLETKKYWPTAFHENKELEQKLAKVFFNNEKLKIYSKLYLETEKINGGIIYDSINNNLIVKVDGQNEKIIEHPVIKLINALAEIQLKKSNNNQYLATGYDAILCSEPCTMCAMALVHARIKRVIFGKINSEKGALISKWRLQEEQSINHHFEVFQLVENL